MKKGLCVLISLLLLLCSVSFAAAAALTKDSVTEENWKSLDGTVFELKADGTGVITYSSGAAPNTLTWSIDGEKVMYAFDSYPTYKFALTSGEKDGYPVLTNPQGAVFYKVSAADALLAEYEKVEYEVKEVALGETISIDGADLMLDSFRTGKEIKGASGVGIKIVAKDDSEVVFCMMGTVENTGGETIQMSRIKTELFLDDQRFSPAKYVEYDGSLVDALDPLCDGNLVIGVSVPKDLAENYTDLTLKLAMNDGLKEIPAIYQTAQYVFELKTTRDVLSGAENVVVRARTCFEDVPELPDPTSFVDVYQSGASKSSVNGKVSKNVVKFKTSSGEDIKDLLNIYLEKIQEEGFTVKSSGGTHTIYSGSKKLVSVSISSGVMEFNLIP